MLFIFFFKIKQRQIQRGDRRGLDPHPAPTHTKKHISSINEEEKEEEEEREGEEGVGSLICGYILACLDLWNIFLSLHLLAPK